MKLDLGLKVLTKFYAVGYRELRNKDNFYGIFFSDSGIIYYNKKNIHEIESEQSIKGLSDILRTVTKLNKEFLIPSSNYRNYSDIKFMTRCAIAFGDLKIMELSELPNVEKQPLYGQAFVDAYESAEGISEHKMHMGEVRITYKKSPNFKKKLEALKEGNSLFNHLYKIGNSHAYFSWTGIEDPSNKLHKTLKEGKLKAKKAAENEMENLYDRQLNIYTNWVKQRKL